MAGSASLNRETVTWGNVLRLAALGVVIGSAFLWNLKPNYLSQMAAPYTKYLILPFGLKQEWEMFGGPKATGDYAARIDRLYADGRVERQQLRGPRTTFARSSFNKMYENLVYDNGTLIIPLLQRVCQDYQRPDRSLVRVTMYRAWIPVPYLKDATDQTDPFAQRLNYIPAFSQPCR